MTKYATLPASRENDTRMEHLLKGMRSLKLRVYPENELEMSADFMQALAALFSNAATQTLKLAYADTFVSLLHPVVETATAEVNHPIWSQAIAVILQRAHLIATKPKYWPAIFPLITLALCVSPRDIFMQQWQPTIDVIMAKLKVSCIEEELMIGPNHPYTRYERVHPSILGVPAPVSGIIDFDTSTDRRSLSQLFRRQWSSLPGRPE